MALAGGLALTAAACSSSPASSRPAASVRHDAGDSPAAASPTASAGRAPVAAAWRGQFAGYGASAWRNAWGYMDQASFGQAQLSVASNASAPGGGPALKVFYGQGSSANSCSDCANPGGAQFYTSLAAAGKARLARAKVLYLRYYLKFPAGFDFGRGGKLPVVTVGAATRERPASRRPIRPSPSLHGDRPPGPPPVVAHPSPAVLVWQ